MNRWTSANLSWTFERDTWNFGRSIWWPPTWAQQQIFNGVHYLQDLSTSQQFLDAIRSRQTINQRQFELTLCEHIIGGWRDLDILTPHEAHHSSRIMRTYHTHVGLPLGNTSGWWDDRKKNQKPVLPLYLCLDIPSNLSRALSCLRLSGHNILVQRMRHDRNRRPYEPGSVTDVTGTLFTMRITFCWTVRMNI